MNVVEKKSGAITRVDRIGKRTLNGNTLTLENRTNFTSIVLSAAGAERWRRYLMAYGNRGSYNRGGGRNWSSNRGPVGGGSSRTNDSRITGLFETKRQGLFTGSVKDEGFDRLIAKIKAAKAAGKGLAVFLWESQNGGRGKPVFSLNVDVESDREQPRATRRQIEPDDNDPTGDPEDDDLFG